MNNIKLNGADAQAIADLIGGTLILVDETNDSCLIAGGDVEKLIKLDTITA